MAIISFESELMKIFKKKAIAKYRIKFMKMEL